MEGANLRYRLISTITSGLPVIQEQSRELGITNADTNLDYNVLAVMMNNVRLARSVTSIGANEHHFYYQINFNPN
jgi:hypothetical protein